MSEPRRIRASVAPEALSGSLEYRHRYPTRHRPHASKRQAPPLGDTVEEVIKERQARAEAIPGSSP